VFDAKKAGLAELKARFERALEVHSPDAGRLGRAYLAALAEFLKEADHGPPADSQRAALDTTGTVNRDPEYTDWVAGEHIRVRRALAEESTQPIPSQPTGGSG
jgi:hypothetical protein